MRRILVIGCPGSGKSTFAKRLHEITRIPLCHLDLLYWNEDRTTVVKSVFLERLEKVLAEDAWILDGNYASTMEHRMNACDTVFFLDYPAEVCLAGVRERWGKKRSDMPWIETEEDREFMEFISKFEEENRPQILHLLAQYAEKERYIFKNRAEAAEFLKALQGGDEKWIISD